MREDFLQESIMKSIQALAQHGYSEDIETHIGFTTLVNKIIESKVSSLSLSPAMAVARAYGLWNRTCVCVRVRVRVCVYTALRIQTEDVARFAHLLTEDALPTEDVLGLNA